MWQWVIVGLIVAAASVFAVWWLMPARARLAFATVAGDWARAHPRAPRGLRRVAAALERAAKSKAGGCADCGTVAPPASRIARIGERSRARRGSNPNVP